MECLSEERNIGKLLVSSRRPLKPKRRTTLTSWSQSSTWLYRTIRVPWCWLWRWNKRAMGHILPRLTPRILLHGTLQLILSCDVLKPATVWKAILCGPTPCWPFQQEKTRIEQKFSLFWPVCFKWWDHVFSWLTLSFYSEIWSPQYGKTLLVKLGSV